MRIGIIDREDSFQIALRTILESRPSFDYVIGGESNPDLIISTLHSGEDSTEFLKQAGHAMPEVPVLVIAEWIPENDIRQLLTLGVAGILLRRSAAQHVPWAIPAILSGCRVLPPEISESVISAYLGSACMTPQERSACDRVHRLSHREHEVLQLLGRGMSNREIAASLFISPETVKDHVRAIRSKLGVTSRVLAAHVAWLARGAASRKASQARETAA
ncbi:LuxR C-terminal-related transcriptional regulator [Streptomyces sp. NPDC059378]|uniref:response regulator transcription factor n=1 Tax=Streptomyces sp. NPDC059378 TaxID=3346815 RepID=UPI00369791CC